MVNKVILIGRLGKEPEAITFGDGVKKVSFSVATSESYKDQGGEWREITEWHNIVGWRGVAERMEKVLSKGRLVFIEGKIRSRSYDDKDGNKRYITEIVVDNFNPLDKKPDSDDRGDYNRGDYGSGQDYSRQTSGGPERQEASGGSQKTSGAQPQQEMDDDDLPF